MPDALKALVAFVAEHQRCGDLDGGRDDARVWLAGLGSFTWLMRLLEPLPTVAPASDSAVVRSLLAVPPRPS
jgi:hypothetical protein